MSDYSSFYRINFSQLDGDTLVPSFTWGDANPSQYRTAEVEAIGRFDVDSLTRSSPESAPIARAGSLIIARCPTASSSARIAVLPGGTNNLSQLQPLTRDPFAKLWTFPGDQIYVLDPLARGFLDLYCRPLNFRELDHELELPAARPTAPPIIIETGAGEVAYTPGATRTVYLVSVAAADLLVTAPDSSVVPPGDELVFAEVSGLPFGLVANEINGNVGFGPYYVPSRGTVSLISHGSGYVALGSPSVRSMTLNVGDPLGAFRGVRKINFDVPNATNFVLPNTTQMATDAVLYAFAGGAGDVTLTPAAGGTINGFPSIVLSTGDGVILAPRGSGWIGAGGVL